MRILLVCPFFPPENKIAAVRIAKFAEHWARAGHEVRVLTQQSSATGLAEPSDPLLSVYRAGTPRAVPPASTASKARASLLYRLASEAYTRALALVWPDLFRKWGRQAVALAKRWEWAPDVVVASVGPFSSLIAGSRLARHFRAPLVIDYRDLLSMSTYYPFGSLRRKIDGIAEKRLVKNAVLLSSVSEPLVEELRERYRLPAQVVTNGFDPKDFEQLPYDPSGRELRVTYCGWVTPRRSDPRPFLEGVRKLLDAHPEAQIEVEFYGPPPGPVFRASAELGLEKVVRYRGKVTHEESLAIQANSDLLLLLLWNDPGAVGVYTGKIFEYIGAQRPILMTGYESGAPALLIRDHGLGMTSNDPEQIAEYLWLRAQEKQRTGRVAAPVENEATTLFTREAQSRLMLDAIERAVVGRS